MPLLSRNIAFRTPLKLSSWRKVAIGTWKTAGDPSVYGTLDVDVGPALAFMEKTKNETGSRITLSHFMGKVMALTLARHPEINCILRFGRLYPRKDVDVFFQVAADPAGKELSGMTIRQADRKTIVQIALETQERIQKIREKGDPDFKKMKGTMSLIPGFLAGTLLGFVGFVMYTLNLWTPLFGSPRDPFGSIMITNIGSLGLETAFAPLVPYSRVPLLIAMGAVKDVAVVMEGQVQVRPVMKLCVTFDHRLIDGMHASQMAKTVKKIFANPESEFGKT